MVVSPDKVAQLTQDLVRHRNAGTYLHGQYQRLLDACQVWVPADEWDTFKDALDVYERLLSGVSSEAVRIDPNDIHDWVGDEHQAPCYGDHNYSRAGVCIRCEDTIGLGQTA